jgi:hypothetical protein
MTFASSRIGWEGKAQRSFLIGNFCAKWHGNSRAKAAGIECQQPRGVWIVGIFQLKPCASARFGGFSPKENMLRLRVILVGFMVVGSLSAQEISDAAKVEFFSQKIFPILKENWFKCHGVNAKLKGASHHQSRVVAQGR